MILCNTRILFHRVVVKRLVDEYCKCDLGCQSEYRDTRTQGSPVKLG